MKNSLEVFKGRFEQTEDVIIKPEHKTHETRSEGQKEKRLKRSEQSLRVL